MIAMMTSASSKPENAEGRGTPKDQETFQPEPQDTAAPVGVVVARRGDDAHGGEPSEHRPLGLRAKQPGDEDDGDEEWS